MPVNHFNIIRFRDSRKRATIKLRNGAYAEVERKEGIYIEHYGNVRFAEYQEHFIFQTPDSYSVGPTFLCTCGSTGIVVGANQYARQVKDASSGGYMMVCQHHLMFGRHAQ